MDVLKTGLGIGRTIKNVNRLREIVQVFAKHGFDEFITRGVTSRIPNFVLTRSQKSIKEELNSAPSISWSRIVGIRLRLCFEELGPAFVKFGQLLGSREDLFDTGFIDQMHLLRDKVSPLDFSEVKDLVEKRMGHKVENIFSSVDNIPVGTASIGLVYKGVLKTGEEVVIKVKRPSIEKEISTDFSILNFIISQVEKVSDDVNALGISRVVQEFSISLQQELNFNMEAMNCSRLRKNLKAHDKKNIFYIPKVYKEFSSDSILVLEYLKGIPFSDKVEIEKCMPELSCTLEKGFHLFIKTFLEDGFFHADLHGGNFFYLENGQIGLIDFGLMGSLGKNARQNFVAIIYSILTHDYENLTYEFLDVAEFEKIPDTQLLIRDMQNALAMFVGLTVQQTDFNNVLRSIIKVLKNHSIFLPREWFIIFRALITMDGVGQSLKLDLDIFSMMEKDIDQIIKSNLDVDDFKEELVWYGRDVLTSSRSLPRQLKWFLRDFSKKGYVVDIKQQGYEKEIIKLMSSLLVLTLGVMSSVFFVCGIITLNDSSFNVVSGLSTLSLISWCFSVTFLLLGLKNYYRCFRD